MPTSHVQEHIELIARHEQEFLARRTRTERLGDRMASFIGSLEYVGVHIAVCGLWIAWNWLPVGRLPRFDLYPFPILDLGLAFEAILVASFILMRQSRMARRSEEREQLMLQILLLTERELTAVLGMEREIAGRMGLHEVTRDEKISELSQETSIDEVVQTINESFPAE
jgi:uncharacterized membrane protein